jgi:hypothetical protein
MGGSSSRRSEIEHRMAANAVGDARKAAWKPAARGMSASALEAIQIRRR